MLLVHPFGIMNQCLLLFGSHLVRYICINGMNIISETQNTHKNCIDTQTHTHTCTETVHSNLYTWYEYLCPCPSKTYITTNRKQAAKTENKQTDLNESNTFNI